MDRFEQLKELIIDNIYHCNEKIVVVRGLYNGWKRVTCKNGK